MKAQQIIASQPELPGGDFVFSVTGVRAINDFANAKTRFDQLSGVSGWRLHDLRRTSRTLLIRCGIRPDIAELCLGHRIGGIRGIYDRHEFIDEKRAAFEALAALIERIVRPDRYRGADHQRQAGEAQMTKGSKRGAGPTQVLAPSLVVDQRGRGQGQRALDRNLGAEKHREAQFAAEARAMIDNHPDVSHHGWRRGCKASPRRSRSGVRRDGKPMEDRSLAKKITRYRQQK